MFESKCTEKNKKSRNLLDVRAREIISRRYHAYPVLGQERLSVQIVGDGRGVVLVAQERPDHLERRTGTVGGHEVAGALEISRLG